MDEVTRSYLRDRFAAHYRGREPELPPGAERREWGYIPFTEGPETTMVRHQSLVDLGDPMRFLTDECPRHVYHSVGEYEDPGTRSMASKGWLTSDLVFDLDGDHLPEIDPETARYAEMLAACKDALLRLLSFLENDFGFEEISVVFSGGRGYHVHVRDEAVRRLDRDARREIVEYVLGEGLTLAGITHTEQVVGLGMKNPAEKKTLQTDGGWGARLQSQLQALAKEIKEAPASEAKKRLQRYEGVGEKGSQQLYTTITEQYEGFVAGNLELASPYTKKVARQVLEETVTAESAPIDEPVTTDINRLIRLPGSLHGGSGLTVTPLARDEIEGFDPLVDAVPETFTDNEIRIKTAEKRQVELGGKTHNIPAGYSQSQETVGIFLMTRGKAQKAPD